jgi:hypothetical protein
MGNTVWDGLGMTEKKWDAVPLQSILANGNTEGQIIVPDSTLFRVKQRIFLKSDSLQSRELVINRISPTGVLTLGKVGSNINAFENLSDVLLADSPKIWAERQDRPAITPNEYDRAVYEEEPVMAKRTILVDVRGNRVSSSNPLPVGLDTNIILNTVRKNALFSKPFDQLTVLTKNDDGDPLTIKSKLDGVDVQLLTITYDLDGDFQNAVITEL